MKRLLLSLILFFTYNTLHSEVIESNTLNIILEIVQQSDLIIFDIDNTISNPKTYIGSGDWFDKKVTELIKKGSSYHDAATQIEMVHEFIDLEPINNSKYVISELHNNSISVIALTNRSIPIAQTTIKQLEDIGINFLVTAPIKETLDLFYTYEAKYSNGIIFSSHNNKGKILLNFLSKINKEDVNKIKRIIFVDDRFHHVKDVEKALSKSIFEFLGIHLNSCKEIDTQKKYTCNPLKKQMLYTPNRDEIYNAKNNNTKKSKNNNTHTDECVFCMLADDNQDEKNLLLTRFKYHNLFMNLYPYQKGHLLLIPTSHVSCLSDLSYNEQQELIEILCAIPKILEKALGSAGTNIGINIGKIAGASKPNHIHIHIIPRYNTEYLSFIHLACETQVVGYNMKQLFQELKHHFETLKKGIDHLSKTTIS